MSLVMQNPVQIVSGSDTIQSLLDGQPPAIMKEWGYIFTDEGALVHSGGKEYDRNGIPGIRPGEPEFRERLDDELPWFWDRGLGMLLRQSYYHSRLACLLFALRNPGFDLDKAEYDDNYQMSNMGFWYSSAGSYRNCYVGPDFKLTAQEKMLFKSYNFSPIT